MMTASVEINIKNKNFRRFGPSFYSRFVEKGLAQNHFHFTETMVEVYGVCFFGLILVVFRSPLDVDPYHSLASNSHQTYPTHVL